jgi:hypothetical protein
MMEAVRLAWREGSTKQEGVRVSRPGEAEVGGLRRRIALMLKGWRERS